MKKLLALCSPKIVILGFLLAVSILPLGCSSSETTGTAKPSATVVQAQKESITLIATPAALDASPTSAPLSETPAVQATATIPVASTATEVVVSTSAPILPTKTPVPPISTQVPATATKIPSTATPTAKASRGPVSEAEGEWVTSSYHTAKNYYAKSDPRWKDLSPTYRVWFRTLDDLLAAYPDRTAAP